MHVNNILTFTLQMVFVCCTYIKYKILWDFYVSYVVKYVTVTHARYILAKLYDHLARRFTGPVFVVI